MVLSILTLRSLLMIDIGIPLFEIEILILEESLLR